MPIYNDRTGVRKKIVAIKYILGAASCFLMMSCVNVAAPDKPIVINLNIKIDSTITREDSNAVEEAIEDNAGIF